MEKSMRLLTTLTLTLILTACSNGMPKLFWSVDEGKKPDYARDKSASPDEQSRAPLDVPPELRKDVSVPMPDKVATKAADAGNGEEMPPSKKEAIAGKAVALDARVYTQSPATVFSSVVDAMTSLNLPVQSVDSPSGTITTEWIRKDANYANTFVGSVFNAFGKGPSHTRFRYVVRVLRTEAGKTQLEIRTLGQQYINHHWVNKPLKQKVGNELFSAVEERLGQVAKPAAPSVAPVTPNQSESK